MAHWDLRNWLRRRMPGRWFWIGAAVIAVISIVGIYGIWNANIQMLRYLTIRQAQSGSPQISALLKEFGEEIYLNIFLQAFLFILVELGLVICFLFMARHRHLRQDLAELSAHFESLVDHAGQLNLKPLAVQGNDETASLIRRFNQVIEKLKPSYQTLEETLARQSRALEEVRSRRQQEIERRRQVEKELVLRQFIVDHAGEAIYLVEEDGKLAEVNEVACLWLGYSRAELLSLKITDIDPHLLPEAWPRHWETVSRKKQMILETEHRRKDGTCFPVEIALTHFECGGKEYHCAFARDLTRRKQEEQQRIQEAETVQIQQQTLLQISTTPAFINGDVETVARHLTEAGARLLKVRRCSLWLFEEREGQLRCQDLYDAQTNEHTGGYLLKTNRCPSYLQALQAGRVINAEDAWRDPRTEELADTYLRPQGIVSLLDATVRFSGKFVGVLCTESVESRRSWTDLEVRFAAELADQVSLVLLNRSYRRSERQARQEARSAVSANQAKSNFLASMSHEIRTPLNAILGMADLLTETPLNKEQQKFVQIFREAGENLLNIINDILDISKVEAGHIHLEHIPFDLGKLVEQTGDIMSVRAHKKELELACRVAPGVPTKLMGDPTRLRQVLINFIGNAVKFTESGEVMLDVKLTGPSAVHTEQNTVDLTFSVKDTGIGIPADKIHNIFERFTQADSSTTRKYGGTGLGLTISKSIVDLMGGTISVESKEGRGSIFSFTAPFAMQTEMTPAEDACAPVDLTGRRALVIDDNANNRLILREMLTQWEIVVSSANSGPAGLTALREAQEAGKPYDFVILDYQMPGMDGLMTAVEIRKEPKWSSLAIIMLSSGYPQEDIAAAKKVGIERFLYKPVKRNDMQEAICGELGKKEAAQPQAETAPAASGAQKSLNILLVEDNEDNRLLISTYLKKTPHRLQMAENGAIAVEAFKSAKYDIVLMDMQMPVMDGYAATREIRKWEKSQGKTAVPIIALTAYALKEDEKKSLDAGCTGHMTKPIKKVKLLEALAEYAAAETGAASKAS